MYEELIRNLREYAVEILPWERLYAVMMKAADAIEELQAINERQMLEIAAWNKPKWISVKKRLPEIGEKVLVYYEWLGEPKKHSIAFDIMGITEPGAEKPHWRGHRSTRISHWMHLPEPPKEEGE